MKHCLVFASLISPSKMILFEKKYQTFDTVRSEEHTSELQSQVPISYAVFCLKKILVKILFSYIVNKIDKSS